MTQYSSREPFNDDPEPYVCLHPAPDEPVGIRFEDDCGDDRFDPRPEFDRPQHNPTNPILSAYRRDPGWLSWEYAFDAYDTFGGYDVWDHPKNRFHAFTLAAPEAVDHARRVLTRLANLKEES